MKKYTFTVVIPAHNEEKYVVRCIRSVRAAAEFYGGEVEIIVVCNRCTDRTAELARKCGARVLYNDERCIASVRNTGIFAANGDVVVTIDCDNRMTRGTLKEIAFLLSTGRYIGGGAPIRFERYSFPLMMNDRLCRIGFMETGGFSEIKAAEDVATAKKLRQYAKKCGKKYTVLRRNYLINSTRKYDDMGDWLYFRLIAQNMCTFVKAAFGDRKELDDLLDKMFYDYNN